MRQKMGDGQSTLFCKVVPAANDHHRSQRSPHDKMIPYLSSQKGRDLGPLPSGLQEKGTLFKKQHLQHAIPSLHKK